MEKIIYFFIILINFFFFKNLNYITERLNFYDVPDQRKIHKKKVSKVGGVFLYINFLLHLTLNYIFNNKIIDNYLIIFLSIFFFISLINDKKDIRPIYRLVIFYFVFLAWSYFDKNLIIENLYFQFANINLNLGEYGIYITPLFFVIFLNALNLFDGVNLQSITYVFLFFIFLFLNNIELSNYFYLFIFIFFFSFYNFKNKIFLGDSGITIFAVIITYLIITNYNQNSDLLNCEEIFTIMFLPGVDMLRLYFYRIYKNKNPFLPDKNHIHHYILKIISEKYVFLYQVIVNSILLFITYILNLSFLVILSYLLIVYSATIIRTYDKKIISKNI